MLDHAALMADWRGAARPAPRAGGAAPLLDRDPRGLGGLEAAGRPRAAGPVARECRQRWQAGRTLLADAAPGASRRLGGGSAGAGDGAPGRRRARVRGGPAPVRGGVGRRAGGPDGPAARARSRPGDHAPGALRPRIPPGRVPAGGGAAPRARDLLRGRARAAGRGVDARRLPLVRRRARRTAISWRTAAAGSPATSAAAPGSRPGSGVRSARAGTRATSSGSWARRSTRATSSRPAAPATGISRGWIAASGGTRAAPLVEDWGSPHLDLYAAREGYWRATPSLAHLLPPDGPAGEIPA